MSERLNRRGAAELIMRKTGRHMTVSRLSQLASEGRGPPYVLIGGRAVYERESTLQWVESSFTRPPRARGMQQRGAAAHV